MNRYIDAEKLKIRFGNEMLKVKIGDNDDAENVLSDVLDSMLGGTMTDADVQPVRHGSWIDRCEKCPICGVSKFEDLDADIWADWKPLYCPNCGAKMEEGEE